MKISVITAVYNSADTVAEAITSVASQSYGDVEHLIIEGQSSDGSLAEIGRAHHGRMHLISEADAGLYDALNKGVTRSSGDIIGFLHSDDFFAGNDVLAKVADRFKDPLVEAVFGDLNYVAKVDKTRVVRRWATGPFSSAKLQRGWMPAHPTLYFRRSVYDRLGGFDTRYKISADYDFILRYFSQAPTNCQYIPEVLYYMRLGGDSNRDLSQLWRKSKEDLRAIRSNGVGGFATLLAKNASKIRQFL